jgi:pyruvate,water dikinase
LRREAARLPDGSPRRTALERAAAGVQPRLLGAALVPVAVLLGPLVMVFLWLPARIDPASWNPPPRAGAEITATVDGNYEGPVRLSIGSDLTLDEDTPAVRSPPPVRSMLTRLLARWRREAATRNESDSKIPDALLADLERFLDGPLPPQELTWSVRTPDRAGRYPIAVTTGKTAWLQTAAVVGDRFPPEPREDLGDGRGSVQIVRAADRRSPIRGVTVQYQYPRVVGDRVFLAPLARVPPRFLPDEAWRHWDVGWLLTYLIVYLFTFFPARWLLRLP